MHRSAPRPARAAWQALRNLLGRAPAPPVPADWFNAQELAAYHRAIAPAGAAALDDATWQDLELGRYLALLGARTSIAGRQVLFHRLRAASHMPPDATAAARLARAGLDASPGPATGDDPLAPLTAALQPLRRMDTEVASLLFAASGQPTLPPWVRHLWAVQLGVLAAAGLAAAGTWAVAGLVLVGTLLVSGRVQIALHPTLLQWQAQRRALQALAQAAVDVARLPLAQALQPLLQTVLALQPQARQLQAQMAPRWSDRVPGLAEYANLLALTQYRRCAQQLAALQPTRAAWQQLFSAVAGLEADLAVHAHLRFAAGTCRAEPAAGRTLVLQALRHPLLQPAHPLSLALHGRGVFLSGQNGAGKSTLLRSVGLNVVLGQALGFCYAGQARIPALPVVSSLQVEDSLGSATSLYVAELQRARVLSEAASAPGGALCLVDEIFRGTNPQESVAATAALAHELAASGLLLLASHHRVLAPLLAADLQPLCVERDAAGVQSLREGVLERTNGLALLAEHGFSPATQAVAASVFEWLQAQGTPQAADAPALQRAGQPDGEPPGFTGP